VTGSTGGTGGRYSKLEREQRWVLPAIPAGIVDPVEISDVYVRGTELRLRRMESSRGLIWKLGQKVRVRPGSPETVQMTNIYLAEREYDLLAPLEGAALCKTRWHWAWADRLFSVDVLHGDLEGLILAEIELQPDEDLLGPPGGAVADVTQDDRFSGGALAWLAEEDARRLVVEVARYGEGRG
jgi:CYTH domain-containing protein